MVLSEGWGKKNCFFFLSKQRKICRGSGPGTLTQPPHLGRVESFHRLAKVSVSLVKCQISLLPLRVLGDCTTLIRLQASLGRQGENHGLYVFFFFFQIYKENVNGKYQMDLTNSTMEPVELHYDHWQQAPPHGNWR